MIMKKLMLVLLILISGIIMSCQGPYTAENNGKTITLSIDDPFEVELVSNPSTGYSWDVVSYDSSVIIQVGKPVSESSNSGAVGSPGKVTYNFKAVADGQTTLEMVYRKGWEPNSVSRSFKLYIVVGTMGRILDSN